MTRITFNKSILLFENDMESAELVTHIFEKRGFSVYVRKTVDNYVHDLANFQPAVVLLDLRIPSMGGEIVCRNIKMAYDMPVILFSSDYDIKEISRRAKADDYVQKPYRLAELIKVVEEQYDKVVNGTKEYNKRSPGE